MTWDFTLDSNLMPCIWGQHNNSKIFLEVAILPAKRLKQSVVPSEKFDPMPSPFFKALVDTGAQSTCITKAAAEQVDLSPIGKVSVRGVSGVQIHRNYLFQVGFPLGKRAINKDGKNISGLLFMMIPREIKGAEFDSGGNDFDVLLGMDILSIGSLKVEGNGTFSFSF